MRVAALVCHCGYRREQHSRGLAGNRRTQKGLGMRFWTAIACLLFLTAAVQGEGLDPALVPGAAEVPYSPVSKYAIARLGDLKLSATSLTFQRLKGRMELRFAGSLPCNGWDGLSCARVYEVLNGEAYFLRNKKKGEPCPDAPRWVAIAPVPPIGTTPNTQDIWVSVFDIADYRSYTPDKLGLCGANVFSRD